MKTANVSSTKYNVAVSILSCTDIIKSKIINKQTNIVTLLVIFIVISL